MKDRELQVECEPSSQDTSLVGKASMWTRGLRLGLGPGPLWSSKAQLTYYILCKVEWVGSQLVQSLLTVLMAPSGIGQAGLCHCGSS